MRGAAGANRYAVSRRAVCRSAPNNPRRPPSTSGLIRRSGRIPALPL